MTFDADRYYKTAHYSFDEGYTAMAELLRETSEITAVFAMADVMGHRRGPRRPRCRKAYPGGHFPHRL